MSAAAPLVDASDGRYMTVLMVLRRYGVTDRMDAGRVSSLVSELLRATESDSRPGPGPRPEPVRDAPPAPSRDERAKRKNPTPTTRECSQCREVKGTDAFYWSVKKGRKTPTPSSACKACVSAQARERRLSSARLDALNAARLEFTADDDEAGLRCVDCGRPIVTGDEVVAESGLHHTACVEGAVHA